MVEIAVFIQVGGLIGVRANPCAHPAYDIRRGGIARLQGFAEAQRAREALIRNELPVAEVFDGFCLVAAGVLLLTPGFVGEIRSGRCFSSRLSAIFCAGVSWPISSVAVRCGSSSMEWR